MIQLSMIFSTIFVYYECRKSGRKREKGVGWEATLNQRGLWSFPDTCHVGCLVVSNFNSHLHQNMQTFFVETMQIFKC